MRLACLPLVGLLGVLITPTAIRAAEPPAALPEEAPAVRIIEPRRAEPAPAPRAAEPEAPEPGPRTVAPRAPTRSAAPAESPPSTDAPAPNDDAAAAEDDRAPSRVAAPTEEPRASVPPFFRFGVAGVAGSSNFDGGSARLGLDAHFGAQLTPTFALFGGTILAAALEPRAPRAQQTFYGQFEGDFDDFLYLSAGPAFGLAPRRASELDDFRFTAGLLARAGILVGSRNESGRKNAFLAGVAFLGLLSEEFFYFPMLTLGYERF